MKNYDIIVYCIFDSDYHSPEEILQRKQQALDRNIELHIWTKKEIENYFVIPRMILRLLESEARKNHILLNLEFIETELSDIADQLKDEVFDALSTEFLAINRGGGIKEANNRARQQINEAWQTLDGKLSKVSGKTTISKLSKWSQDTFGVSLSPLRLLRSLTKDELDFELRSFVTAIEKGKRLSR